jgi:hypothetical protein
MLLWLHLYLQTDNANCGKTYIFCPIVHGISQAYYQCVYNVLCSNWVYIYHSVRAWKV